MRKEGRKERKKESTQSLQAKPPTLLPTHTHTPSFTNKLNLNTSPTNAGSPIDDQKHETKPAGIIAPSAHSLRIVHERNSCRFW
jgi:hypothetical protein